jgi:hypothetical protein
MISEVEIAWQKFFTSRPKDCLEQGEQQPLKMINLISKIILLLCCSIKHVCFVKNYYDDILPHHRSNSKEANQLWTGTSKAMSQNKLSSLQADYFRYFLHGQKYLRTLLPIQKIMKQR